MQGAEEQEELNLVNDAFTSAKCGHDRGGSLNPEINYVFTLVVFMFSVGYLRIWERLPDQLLIMLVNLTV